MLCVDYLFYILRAHVLISPSSQAPFNMIVKEQKRYKPTIRRGEVGVSRWGISTHFWKTESRRKSGDRWRRAEWATAGIFPVKEAWGRGSRLRLGVKGVGVGSLRAGEGNEAGNKIDWESAAGTAGPNSTIPTAGGRKAGSKLLGFLALTLEFLRALPNNHNNKSGEDSFLKKWNTFSEEKWSSLCVY